MPRQPKATDGSERKKDFQLSAGKPRNANEAMFLEKYGTITPIPTATMSRKNTVVMAAMLYIHMGYNATDACKLVNIDRRWVLEVAKEDKWDEFAQELAQMARPSNLSMIRAHDLTTVETEHTRRFAELEDLVAVEKGIIKVLRTCKPGSNEETRALGNLKKTRELTDEVSGLAKFNEEMSAARRAALINASKNGPGGPPSKAAKGQIIPID